MPKHYTLTLPDDAAERVTKLTRQFGGSVPAFAGSLAADISYLEPSEIVAIRTELSKRITEKLRKKPVAELAAKAL